MDAPELIDLLNKQILMLQDIHDRLAAQNIASGSETADQISASKQANEVSLNGNSDQ